MLLAALAHAAGARGASVASATSEEEAGLGELKGKDPGALREVLLGAATGGKGGGAGRDMHAARAEDDPLVEPGKRRRAKGGDEGVEIREDEVDDVDSHPAARAKRRREEKEARNEREREVGEVFGSAEKRDGKDQNHDLERIERMDYEVSSLHACFPMCFVIANQPSAPPTHSYISPRPLKRPTALPHRTNPSRSAYVFKARTYLQAYVRS